MSSLKKSEQEIQSDDEDIKSDDEYQEDGEINEEDENSDNESDEEEKDENSDDEEIDDIEELMESLENEDDDEGEVPEEDAVEEEIIGDDDGGEIFEDGEGESTKRKKTVSKRVNAGGKKKLFPFLHKRKKITIDRSERNYILEDISELRDSMKSYFLKTLGMSEKNTNIFERVIFGGTVSSFLETGKEKEKENMKEIEIEIEEMEERDTVKLKECYIDNIRHFIGAYTLGQRDKIFKNSDILAELKSSKYSWNSDLLYRKQLKEEESELEKISKPIQAIEYPEYPCPKCRGIKLFVNKCQDRSGDEGQSLHLWCQSKDCGWFWKIRG